MKNVVLIGDSIRLGYQGYVQELLGPNVKVFGPAENCRYSKFVLWGMFSWMGEFGYPKVDALHFNAGIWDLHRCTADGEIFTEIGEYAENMRRLGIQMQSYTKNVIFANSIPGNSALDDSFNTFNPLINTDPGYMQVHLTVGKEEWNSDIARYNAAATAEMEKLGIPVNDLYSLIIADPEKYICGDGVHPTDEGYRMLAKQVAEKIEAML